MFYDLSFLLCRETFLVPLMIVQSISGKNSFMFRCIFSFGGIFILQLEVSINLLFRKSEATQTLKLLPASSDDSNKKQVLGVTRILMVVLYCIVYMYLFQTSNITITCP